MDVEFYHCVHCGNVAIKPFDTGIPLVCCDEEMEKLTANTVDAAVEKHVPVVTVEGTTAHVAIGSVAHPMIPAHWITLICLVSEKGYQFVELTPEDEPAADFALLPGDRPVKVYEYCNIHGLWVTEL